jgi:hypothetical protein
MSLSLLIDQMYETVSVVGVKKVQEILKSAQYDGWQYPNKDFEFVAKNVATTFSVPIHELVDGTGRKNDRKMAIGFCVYYLKNFGYDIYTDISAFMNKEPSTCFRYCKLVKELNAANSNNKKKNISIETYLEYKEKFDKLFVRKSK